MKIDKNLVITGLVLVIVAAGSFFAGAKYQSLKTRLKGEFGAVRMMGGDDDQVFFRNGQAGQVGMGRGITMGFRPVAGEIISSEDGSITVKLTDGSSKIVTITDDTTINTAAEASASDLKTGESVAVFGTQNSDGTVTAQSVQLNPERHGLEAK